MQENDASLPEKTGAGSAPAIRGPVVPDPEGPVRRPVDLPGNT